MARRPLPLALALILAGATPALAAPTVTEPARLPGAGSGIVAGPDGALWVIVAGKPGAVARVSTAGAVTGFPATTGSSKPSGITVGADGGLYFTTSSGVERVDTSGAVTPVARLTGTPSGIAAGPDGNLWVTEQGASLLGDSFNAVARITPGGAVDEFPSGEEDPFAITAGPDGALWFTDEESIGRMTTAGAVAHFEPSVSDNFKPAGIAAGPGGLWFAADKRVARLTVSGVDATYPASDGVFEKATAIAAGPDGAVWFTAKDGIGRVLPDGSVTLHRSPLTSGDPGTGIATGPDGAMWFTQKEAKVGRITVPPLVKDVAASDATSAGATVRAVARANAEPATATVTVTDGDGVQAATGTVQVPPGLSDVPVAFDVTGLLPSTSYTARVTATSVAGAALPTAAASFKTLDPMSGSNSGDGVAVVASPTPTPSTSPGAGPAAPATAVPQPTLAEAVTIAAAHGEVLVKAKGAAHFTRLAGAASIPMDAVVDTTHGAIFLASALPDATNQIGYFHGGRFRVQQANSGMTDLHLAGSLDCGRQPRSGALATASKKGKPKRKLWGHDDGGSFRTHGRDSVATVRGTQWLTVDRCSGTLTRVVAGAVSVKPRGGDRPAVLVRAGQQRFVTRKHL